MSVPTDTRGKAAGSSFFKPEAGQTEILIVGDAVTGYQYWKEGDGGVVRSKEVFAEPLDGVRMKEITDKKTGVKSTVPEKQQFFWAIPLYNFKTKSYELWQVTQKGIRDELVKLQNNTNWGDPTGKYTITIDKSGEGLKTEYSVMANPVNTDDRRQELATIMAAFPGMDIDAILFAE